MSDDETMLFLYTSNIREKYVDDALSVVAQQSGTRVRFRYAARHFDAALTALWGADGTALSQRRALIHFSIQHPERFHDSAFIPLRFATVVGVQTWGDVRILDLELGGYCALPGLTPKERDEEDAAKRRGEHLHVLGNRIKAYSRYVSESACNPDVNVSAGIVPDFKTFVSDIATNPKFAGGFSSDADEAFHALVQYLTASLTNPSRFYYRVASVEQIVKTPDGTTYAEVELNGGEYKLTTGESYRVNIVQRQHSSAMLPADLQIIPGDGIDAMDVTKMELRSTYDAFPLVVYVEHQPSPRRSYLDLKPSVAHAGPEVRLPLVLTPPLSQTYAVPGAAAVATIVVTLAGARELPTGGWGAGLAFAAAGALFFLTLWQAKRGLKLFGR